MKKQFNLKNYLIMLPFCLLSCSSPTAVVQDKQTKQESVKLVSGTSQAVSLAKIVPNIGGGQTLINLRKGDSNLVFNVNIASKAGQKLTSDGSASYLTSDGMPAFFTKAAETNQATAGDKVDKVAAELKVNDEKLNFEIPADKLEKDKYRINLIGLQKGDVVSLEGKAYDNNGKLVGSESVKDKKVEKDIEDVPLNISVTLNIQVNVTQTVNQTVNQNQTVNVK